MAVSSLRDVPAPARGLCLVPPLRCATRIFTGKERVAAVQQALHRNSQKITNVLRPVKAAWHTSNNLRIRGS